MRWMYATVVMASIALAGRAQEQAATSGDAAVPGTPERAKFGGAIAYDSGRN